VADASDFGAARYVLLLDVLEHQEDDKTFLRELVGKMAPGSKLLLTVPALERLWSSWDVALGHYRRYERDTLRACTDGLPLVVDEMVFLFPEMVPMGMVRRRQSRAAPEGEVSEDADFPRIPRVLNELLFWIGTVSLALRRRWWTGTSLFLAATVTH